MTSIGDGYKLREYFYEPPEPIYQDVLLAFQRLSAPVISATVEPDSLGDVNKIVRLRCGGRVVKTALCHVPDDASVTVGRTDYPAFTTLSDLDYTILHGYKGFVGYYVEVDGRRVIEATDAEMRPPKPLPHSPWKSRIKRWVERAAAQHIQPHADRLAERLGYHRECGY